MTFYRRLTWLGVLLLLTAISLANLLKVNVVQGTLCSLGIGPVSINCPIGTAQVMMGLKQFSLPMLLFVVLPLASFALFGRGFCGWVCPQGAPSEWGSKLSGKIHGRSTQLPSPVSRQRGRTLLLTFLIGGLVGSFLFGIPLLCYICPVGAICRGIVGGTIGQTLGAEILVVGLILLVEITIARRGYCKYLCPIGALGSLLVFRNSLRVERDPSRCEKCSTCVSVCSMGNSAMDDLTSPTCTNCGTCVEKCPHNALSFKR